MGLFSENWVRCKKYDIRYKNWAEPSVLHKWIHQINSSDINADLKCLKSSELGSALAL